jgi:hypothetical protein
MTLASSFSDSPTKQTTVEKTPKLRKSDIPYLTYLAYCKTKLGFSCIKKEGWPKVLQQYGGKPISYVQFKRLMAKHRKMGTVTYKYTDGRRRKPYEHHITDHGLKLLEEYKKRYLKSDPSKYKSDTSKPQKRYPESIKNDTSISKDKLRSHACMGDALYTRLKEEEPELDYVLELLAEVDTRRNHALNLIERYGSINVMIMLDNIKKIGSRIRSVGACLTSGLRDKYGA